MPDPNPASTNAAAPGIGGQGAPAVELPPLPEGMEKGGRYDQVLESCRSKCYQVEGAQYIRNLAVETLGTLQIEGQAAFSFNRTSEPLLHYHYLAETGANPETVEAVKQKALSAYLKAPQAYNLVFGELLKEEFVNHAKWQSACQVYKDGTSANVANDMAVYNDRLRQRQETATANALTTGLPTLDKLTGGLAEISILAGDTQTGKTQTAIEMGLAALTKNPRAGMLLFALDHESHEQVIDRIICTIAGVNVLDYQQGSLSPEQNKKVAEAMTSLSADILCRVKVVEITPNFRSAKLCFEDHEGVSHTKGLDSGIICGQLASLHAVGQYYPILTVIDLLQQMPVPESITADSLEADRWRIKQLQEVYAQTCQWATGGWPILVLSQARKPERQRQRIEIADIKGSAGIAYSVKRIMLLSADPDADPAADATPITLTVAKCTGGRCGDVPLVLDHVHSRMEEAQSKLKTPAAASLPRQDDSNREAL